MLALGIINSITAVVSVAGADRPAEKRQIISAVRRALGVPDSDDDAPARTDTLLPVSEAARRLGRSTRTVQYYAQQGLLRGVRTGRTRRLTGIPASEIDAFIARQTTQETQPA